MSERKKKERGLRQRGPVHWQYRNQTRLHEPLKKAIAAPHTPTLIHIYVISKSSCTSSQCPSCCDQSSFFSPHFNCSALLPQSLWQKRTCLFLFIYHESQSHRVRAACQKSPLQTRWAKQKDKEIKIIKWNPNSIQPQGIFWRGENNWGQGPGDKRRGQRLAFIRVTHGERWYKSETEKNKRQKGGKGAYFLGIVCVTLLAHTQDKPLVWQPLWDDWQWVVAGWSMCVCVCMGGESVQEFHRGITSLACPCRSNQLPWLWVCVCGCWRGGLAIKWKGLLLIIALWPRTKAKRLLGQFEFE